MEYFDINDYGPLWNPDWKLAGAGRGGAGVTFLDGDTLVTYPRDARPCRLERTAHIPAGHPKLELLVGAGPDRPWRLQVMADDDIVFNQKIAASETRWTPVTVDLSKYANTSVTLRLYQWTEAKIAASAYWKSVRLE